MKAQLTLCELRSIVICGLLAAAVPPCHGAKRLTVAQLEQTLAAETSAHKSDLEIARHFAGIALSERISQTTFARITEPFRSSPQSLQALRILADQAEFLDLPASESVADAVPDGAAQTRMLQAARSYVSQTLRRLPNFLATRTIHLSDDRPQAIKQGEWPMRAGLHLVGTSKAEISVSREREDQPPAQGSAVWQSKIGLVSGGEFGSTLGMILADAEAGDVSWGRWERTPEGILALFRYSVPASASHFEIISTLQREANLEGIRGPADGRGVSGIEVRPNVSSSNIQVVRTKPAYHGSIWLDPADGIIYRITLEADMKKGLPFRRAAILVEYGPVEIAGTRFICPVRSLALSESFVTAQQISGDGPTAWQNETVFTDYHRFGSSSRIVETAANAQDPDTTPTKMQSAPASAGPDAAQVDNLAGPTRNAEEKTPAADQAQAALSPAPTSAPSSNTEDPKPGAAGTETLASSSNAPPVREEAPASPTQPLAVPLAQSGLMLRINVNSLLLPVVVLDRAGRAVGGLAKENFKVNDDGKHRTITGLTLIKSAPNPGKEQNPTTGRSASTDSITANESARHGNRYLIFLFDDRHMTTAELPLVQKAAIRLLERPLPETDYMAVLSFMGVNSGITRDRAVLQSAITKVAVHQAFLHGKEYCPDVDYYSADQIINTHNAIEFQIAVEKAKQCSFLQLPPSSVKEDMYVGMNNPDNAFQRAAMAAATNALAVGEEDARESLVALGNVVRAMSKLPGQRVLIFVSSGFLSLAPETMAVKSEIMDMAAASDVVVNALDARGLYAGNLDASQGGTTSTLGLTTGQITQDHLASMQASENAMSELAQGTGGRFFHNSNDLQGGMDTLTAVPENLYLLEVSLKDVKANGAYHRLQVKVDQPGLEVLARKGYFAPGAAISKKQH